MEENNSLSKTKEKLSHRLTMRKHFAYVYKKGNRVSSKYFNLFACKSKFHTYKIGYSISKKLGKAHLRNKLKRRLREIVRNAEYIRPYQNYVLVARDGAQDLSFEELEKQVKYIFSRLELKNGQN